MKLLITGGCGFLGSNLAHDAISRGDQVEIFDNLSREGAIYNLEWLTTKGGFSFSHGDIRNRNDINKVIKNSQPDVVFHLAGQVAMTTSIEDPVADFEINTLGTLNLLEAIRLYSPHAGVIYSSTNKVYGDLEQYRYSETETRYTCVEKPNGFDENTSLEFHSPYGCSKGAADQYVLDYSRIYGVRTVVFRHSSMYGGRQFATYDQGWIGWFCRKAVEQELGFGDSLFTISGTGKQVRDVLHADDMKRLYSSATKLLDETSGHAFNVGGGIDNSLSLLELFSMLEEITGVRLRYEKLPPRESDQRIFVSDLSKVKKHLNWEPKVSSKEGIEMMLSWTRERLRK